VGLSDAFRDGSNYYSQIITRYSATIAATFFGHTHVDQFEIAYSDYNAQNFSNALEVSYICPSMTPTSGSPAFRVYTVDPVTFGVLDVETYIANISSPTYQTEGPVWEKYYSAKEVYGGLVEPPISDPAAELTPAFWHNITAVFESDDAEFQSYYQRQSRGYSNSTCTGTCKTQQICGMRAAESQYNCATITPGINFKKRDEGAVTRAEGVIGMGECEGSMLRPIIAKIVAKNGVLEDGYERARQRYGGLSPAS
jgi:sphingomyelin phosphodiesterase